MLLPRGTRSPFGVARTPTFPPATCHGSRRIPISATLWTSCLSRAQRRAGLFSGGCPPRTATNVRRQQGGHPPRPPPRLALSTLPRVGCDVLFSLPSESVGGRPSSALFYLNINNARVGRNTKRQKKREDNVGTGSALPQVLLPFCCAVWLRWSCTLGKKALGVLARRKSGNKTKTQKGRGGTGDRKA